MSLDRRDKRRDLGQRRVFDVHVRRQGQVAGRDRPDVQVVHALDPGDAQHRLLDVGEFDALGRPFHEHVDGAPHDPDRLPADPERDQDRHDRVGVVPVPEIDDEAADHHPEAGGGIADQVQEGGPQVEIVAVGAEQHRRQRVDHQAAGREADDPQPSTGGDPAIAAPPRR